MKKKTKIILAIAVVLIVVVFVFVYIQYTSQYCNGLVSAPFIVCSENKTADTLTVNQIDLGHGGEHVDVLYWEDIEVIYGNATLPSGRVELGDVITNCSKEGSLVYRVTDTILCTWYLEE